MITSSEYRKFAHECTRWAVETDTEENRKSFLALAKDWTFAAMATDRIAEKQEDGKIALSRYGERSYKSGDFAWDD
jgi:hypothetical protein